ncbi:MAG: hypothetical protein KF871_09065 [Hydrogenophaga sp.]|uniref:hypothetical protein n=1 Tax=Hydrogenophaga sp. TaxID=1904254 RepID=UPI001E18F988|nr:hypothetical protein [Hydrogenophaga sp.]MBX3610037.1 hypothetical protein [Hydrogenophaga sp.]
MKRPLLTWLASCSLVGLAQAQHSDAELKEDIARHRAMAVAHEAAARCLEAGKGEKQCYAELTVTCKGLALGKFCGLRHAH